MADESSDEVAEPHDNDKPEVQPSASCDDCGRLLVQPENPHAVSDCRDCGRMTYRLPTEEGLRTEEGDSVVFPAGSIQLSLDPSQASGRFYRPGVAWFVQHLLTSEAPSQAVDVEASLEKYRDSADKLLRESPLLHDFNLDDDESASLAAQFLNGRHDAPEFWAMSVGAASLLVEDSLRDGNTRDAVWAMSRVELSRAMLLYTQTLEPLVWRGYSTPGIDALQALLVTWNENRANDDEAFWQDLLTSNSTLVGQILHVPMLIHSTRAYIGGKRIDNRGGKYPDFVLQSAALGMSAILEIKTPTTPLVGSQYRDEVYAPSVHLNGSVIQALSYREELMRQYHVLRSTESGLEAVDPACIILIGDAENKLDTRAKRESFELYRRNLRNVHVVTFDELFIKLNQLVQSLSLQA